VTGGFSGLRALGVPRERLPSGLDALRAEVRDVLAAERAGGRYRRSPAGWDSFDPAFSRRLAQRGWIGMTWPRAYGGQERSALERYVVQEELLAAGAPVRAHWLADRQIGPLLLAVGTEAQKAAWLPRIAAGECFLCVAMSEPDSGSDLASIRTRAEPVAGGWRITGSKTWSSNAHRVHAINVFARTAPRSENDRHGGVTQFLVDRDAPGLTVRPIVNAAGEHDFNEVHLDGVLVPENRLIGKLHGAWSQVSDELAYERAGPERWMNSYNLIVSLADAAARGDLAEGGAERFGRLVAHLWTLHRMSLGTAALLGEGVVPAVEAAMVKDLGTNFDQLVPEIARLAIDPARRTALPPDDPLPERLAYAQLYAPSFTIRGGTREVLRGIIARGLGLR